MSLSKASPFASISQNRVSLATTTSVAAVVEEISVEDAVEDVVVEIVVTEVVVASEEAAEEEEDSVVVTVADVVVDSVVDVDDSNCIFAIFPVVCYPSDLHTICPKISSRLYLVLLSIGSCFL